MKYIVILLFLVSCANTLDSDFSIPEFSIPMEDHWRRVECTLQCKWRPENQLGRKSEFKGCFFEFTHAKKNYVVEFLRQNNIWNRKNRDPFKEDGYIWPEDC